MIGIFYIGYSCLEFLCQSDIQNLSLAMFDFCFGSGTGNFCLAIYSFLVIKSLEDREILSVEGTHIFFHAMATIFGFSLASITLS